MPLHPVGPVAGFPVGAKRIVTFGKVSVGVFNVDGTLYAYRNVCPHAGAPVCEGPVSGTTLPSPVYEYNVGRAGCILRCPWHGWEFDLTTGAHLVDPDLRLKAIPVEVGPEQPADSLEKFPVEISAGQIYVRLPG
jgi:nitrite reductase (NADH) small subunit